MKKNSEEPQEIAQFDIADLLPIGLVLIILVVGISVGLDIVTDVQSDFVTNTAGCNATVTTSCGAAYNATGDGMAGITKLTSKLPIIGTAIAFAVILAVLVRYLFIRMS